MVCRDMENIDIKYSEIKTLMSEYRNNIGKNLNQFSTLMNDINALVGDKVDFAGQGAENIRNYYAQVYLTLLTGIMEAMQAMLSEVAVYKDGYDSIDGSEDFHYNENASEDLHTELEFQSEQMNTYHQEVRENLYNSGRRSLMRCIGRSSHSISGSGICNAWNNHGSIRNSRCS